MYFSTKIAFSIEKNISLHELKSEDMKNRQLDKLDESIRQMPISDVVPDED